MEMKNLLEELNSRLEHSEERIRKPKGKSIEIIQSEEQKENRKMKNEHSLRDLWDPSSVPPYA